MPGCSDDGTYPVSGAEPVGAGRTVPGRSTRTAKSAQPVSTSVLIRSRVLRMFSRLVLPRSLPSTAQ